MTSLRDYLRTIAFVLNDDEPGLPFQRYTLEQMIAQYNNALCIAAKFREDLFTEYEKVRLESGRYQDLRGCCAKVLDVLDQVNEDGSLIKKLGVRSTETKASTIWKKPSCLINSPTGYIITSIDLDRNMDGRFIVEPPVPCGVDVYVTVKCVSSPVSYTVADAEAELDAACELNVAAWHYVLSTMLSGDRSSNPAQADKQYHYRMFFDLLGIVLKQTDRLEETT
jgi:hypothetical protein